MKNQLLTLANIGYVAQELRKLLAANPEKKYFVNVSEKPNKRGLPANAQQHLWYGEIAKHYGDRSAIEVKNFCKDALGLPILLQSAEHGEKLEFLLSKLDYYKHSYESKMKLIQCLTVTSDFNTKESKQYMDHMIHYFNDLGVMIKFKDQ